MKTWRSIISLLLVLVFALELLPLSSFAAKSNDPAAAEAVDASEPAEQAAEDTNAADEPIVAGEVEELREETVKHFRMSDGSFIAVQYGAPVHYKDGSDQWQEIDNTLTAKNGKLVTKYGDVEKTFSQTLTDGKLFNIKVGDYSIGMSLMSPVDRSDDKAPAPEDNNQADLANSDDNAEAEEAEFETSADDPTTEDTSMRVVADPSIKATVESKAPLCVDASMRLTADKVAARELSAAEVCFSDVLQSVDLNYQSTTDSIKESIIIKAPQSSYSYSFLMTLSGVTPKLQDDGAIICTDKDGAEVFVIPAPFLIDDAGELSMDAKYTLDPVKDGWLLTITADSDWINDPERSFPVTLDPTVDYATSSSNSNLPATFVIEGAPNSHNTNPTVLPVGRGAMALKELQTFLALDINSSELPYKEVINAKLVMTQSYFDGTALPSIMVTAHRVTGSKGSQSYTSWIRAMTWNTKPAFDNEILDYASAAPGTVSFELDVTRAVKSWFADNTVTRALALTAYTLPSSGVAASYLGGYSVYRPRLYISYRDDKGLENHCYTYQSFSVGNAGTAYISDHSSRLTLVTPLASFASTANPFSLELIYNNGMQTGSTVPTLGLRSHLGQDMKLSIMQKVETSGAGLKYTDGDGTEHYFANDPSRGGSNMYYDEDGLGFKIEVSNQGNSYMTDDKGHKWTFTNGYLTIMEDGNGNRYEIHYIRGDGGTDWRPCGTNDKLQSVVQKNNGASSEIRVATFTHNNYNYITSITDFAGRIVSLNYSSGTPIPQIVSITRRDATLASFSYGTYITRITDGVTGCGLAITYDDKCVSSFNYFGAGSDNNRETTTVLREGDHTTYTTGPIATTYIFDNVGRTANVYTTQSEFLVGAANAAYSGTGDTNRKNNRMLQTGEIGVAAHSWMRNGGFENSSAFTWTLTGARTFPTNIVIKPDKTRTGNYALKGWLADNATGTTSARHDTYNLGNNLLYAASAYVNTSQITGFGDGGCIKLEVLDSSDNVLGSDEISYQTSPDMDGGWTRLSVSFISSGIATIRISAINANGIFYADDVQIEPAVPQATIAAPSNVNLLDNGNCQYYGDGWVISGTSYYIGIGRGAQNAGAYSLCASGSPTASCKAFQTVPINLPGTETYTLSGWALARSVYTGETMLNGVATDPTTDGQKRFGLCAELTYSDGNKEYHYVPFNADLTEWQFISVAIVPKQSTKTVASIKVICLYNYNANTNAYFDDLSLVREVAQTMKYDNDGNLQSVKSTGATADQNTFTNGKLIQTITAGSGTLTYSYENNNNSHLITKITDGAVKDSFSYDQRGNITQEDYSAVSGGAPIRQKNEYSDDGNCLIGTTVYGNYQDSEYPNANTTSFEYSSSYNKMTALPSRTSNFRTSINSSYEQIFDRVTEVHQNGVGTLTYSYSDTNGQLDKLIRQNYTGDDRQTYFFKYNAFGDRTAIKVGELEEPTNSLASYTYDNSNGNLTRQTYANGSYTDYAYDPLYRISSKTTFSNGNSREVLYAYNGNGDLAEVRDGTYETTRYTYDNLNRLANCRRTNPNGTLNSSYRYDDCGRLTRYDFQVPGAFYGYESFYYKPSSDANGAAGSLTSMSMFSYCWISYEYDSLHRLNSRTIGAIIRENFSYATSTDGTTSLSTTQRSEKAVLDVNNSNTQLHRWEYKYDRAGNIVSEKNKVSNQTTTYTYDAQNQLTGVSAPEKTYSYTYDNAGNIQTASDGNATHSYTYGDSQWKDLLTAYDGHAITYDAIGNPLSYYNGNSYTFTWAEGRRLQTATNGTTTTTYTYDADGLRTRKTNADGSHYDYFWADGRLLAERRLYAPSGSILITYLYDESHSPVGLLVGYGQYYFAKNLQGDVVAIYERIDNNGTLSTQLVAQYEYDPWGKVTVKTASGAVDTNPLSIGNINPFRFKGYYYDGESGFYYLQSRYYDPAIGRFISADAFATTDIEGFLSCNMFAYCENNPVSRCDPTGEWGLDTLVGAVVGAVVSVASYCISNGSSSTATGCLDAALSGAVSGALFSGTFGFRALGAAAQGVYTAVTTKGNLKQRLLCGVISGVTALGLSCGANYLGKSFVTVEEKIIGNSIVGTAAGALSDTATRTTQYVVCGNNHNGNGTSHNRTASNRRAYGRGGRKVELLLV